MEWIYSMYCDSIKMERDLSGKITIIQFSNMGTTLELYAEKIMILNMMRNQRRLRFLQSDATLMRSTITII